MKPFIARAAEILLGGGIVTCPTEGVFGLSCMPDDPRAIRRLLAIKDRDPTKGLILIAAGRQQLQGWVAISPQDIPDPDKDRPVTWIVPAAATVSELVRGEHAGLAVRLTTHPVARALCEAVESPLVSTSANRAGEAPTTSKLALRRKFADRVDYLVPGDCGPADGPSEIRVLASGKKLR